MDNADEPTNPDLEMNEAANTLLSLSGNVNRTTDELKNTPKELDMTNTESELTRPPVALEVNVIIDPKDNSLEINPEKIIGSAIKEEYAKPVKQADVCVSEKTKKKVKTVSTKHFRMKSYKLKRKTEIKRRFKCRICPEILERVYINTTATIGRNTHRFHVLTAHVVLMHLGIFRGTSTLTPKSCMNVLNAKRVLLLTVSLLHITVSISTITTMYV